MRVLHAIIRADPCKAAVCGPTVSKGNDTNGEACNHEKSKGFPADTHPTWWLLSRFDGCDPSGVGRNFEPVVVPTVDVIVYYNPSFNPLFHL